MPNPALVPAHGDSFSELIGLLGHSDIWNLKTQGSISRHACDTMVPMYLSWFLFKASPSNDHCHLVIFMWDYLAIMIFLTVFAPFYSICFSSGSSKLVDLWSSPKTLHLEVRGLPLHQFVTPGQWSGSTSSDHGPSGSLARVAWPLSLESLWYFWVNRLSVPSIWYFKPYLRTL